MCRSAAVFFVLFSCIFLLCSPVAGHPPVHTKHTLHEGSKYKFLPRDLPELNFKDLPKGNKLTPTNGPYNTNVSRSDDPTVLNVHLVAHTHDDVGWLKTVDQYFIGLNNSIQDAGVQYILDSVMISLQENPDRKFIYVEMGFFQLWWHQQSSDMKTQVRAFVKNGQLEFINGGWCMSDEAAPFFVDMIDQQTAGHLFLTAEFGADVLPTTGWQIDPFGHSAFMATAYALMGMDSWYFGRIDYQDRKFRELSKTTELVMRSSSSLPASSVDIFTGVMRGYSPPKGFDWEVGADDPISDDDTMESFNLQYEVDLFVAHALEQAQVVPTHDIMIAMGDDFDYQYADSWYKNMDKLIHYLQEDGRVNAFYSTPTLYTQAKQAAKNMTWTLKTDDWFPYADTQHAFWTGYFTSRPALKGYVRSTSNFLQACRQLEVAVPQQKYSSQQLWEAMSVAQHHDAISGTSKQHVADDYTKQLSQGYAECVSVLSTSLSSFLSHGKSASNQADMLTFQTCPLLNQSFCHSTTDGKNVAIVVYNPLGTARTEVIEFPVPKNQQFTVVDHTGNTVPVDVFESTQSNSKNDRALLAVNPPAFGYTTYVLEVTANNISSSSSSSSSTAPPPVQKLHGKPTVNVVADEVLVAGEDVTISNGVYTLTFSGSSGHLVRIENKITNSSTNLLQSWGWYNSSADRGQNSGAYIFRPECAENTPVACKPYAIPDDKQVSLSVKRGALVHEVTQVFSSWVSQKVRLYQSFNEAYIEVQYTVGPIPIDDHLGKEVVSVWETDMNTDNTWYTDSNGRDMQERKLNYRPTWDLYVTDPVSGNYYPVNSAITMHDQGTKNSLTILTDRSQGGASLWNGELELMVHRRILHDDSRGVGEPLNETAGAKDKGLKITGTHRIIFADEASNSKLHRLEEEQLTYPSILAFTKINTVTTEQFLENYQLEYTGVVAALPANVHLLTLQDNSYWGEANTLLLRLSHSFSAGESSVFNDPVTLNITGLFSDIMLSKCTEMSLSANQPLSNLNRMTWNVQETVPITTEQQRQEAERVPRDLSDNVQSVTIYPMEIRTFLCSVNVKANKR